MRYMKSMSALLALNTVHRDQWLQTIANKCKACFGSASVLMMFKSAIITTVNHMMCCQESLAAVAAVHLQLLQVMWKEIFFFFFFKAANCSRSKMLFGIHVLWHVKCHVTVERT